MDALMDELEAIPHRLAAQRLGRDAQGPARPDQLRPRPDPPGPRRRLLLPGPVQRRVVRRRRRRAHRCQHRGPSASRAPAWSSSTASSPRAGSTTSARSPSAPSTSGASTSARSTCAASAPPPTSRRAPSTAGWKEGEDIVCAGRFLKGPGSTTVGALGISLGGSSVLGACHLGGRRGGARRRRDRDRRPRRHPLHGPEDLAAAPPRPPLRPDGRPAGDARAPASTPPAGRSTSRTSPIRSSSSRPPTTGSSRRSSGSAPPPATRSPGRGSRCSSCTPPTTGWSRSRQAEVLREAAAGNELVRVWTVAARRPRRRRRDRRALGLRGLPRASSSAGRGIPTAKRARWFTPAATDGKVEASG